MRERPVGGRWAAALAVFALVLTQLASAAFPGANGRIVWGARDASGDSEIFSMAADGTGRLQLTSNTLIEDSSPTVSPDGKQVVFVSDEDGDDELFVMNVDGTGRTQVTANAVADTSPTFASDGIRVAFARSGEIVVRRLDTAAETTLTSGGGNTAPAWSPNGLRIAWVKGEDIWAMDADGALPGALTTDGAVRSDSAPSWSPDSTQIVYSSYESGSDEIRRMNADGSGQAQIGTATGFEPAWSPDGTKILFLASGPDLFVMNADGTTVVNLTSDGNQDLAADWQRVPAAPPPSPPPPPLPPEPEPTFALACSAVGASGSAASTGRLALVGSLGVGGFVYCVAGASGATETLSRLTGAILGGGGSSSRRVVLVGSLGQPVAATSRNARHVLHSGFAYVPSTSP